VQNFRVGDGRTLVHPLQVNFIHQLVQERLQTGSQPLLDAYTVLHSFCQSLQLSVLHAEVIEISIPTPNYVKVEEYDPAKSILVIGYWVKSDAKNKQTSSFRVTIRADNDDPHCALKTQHHPPALPQSPPGLNDICLADSARISIEQLITRTIIYRCVERLLEVETRLNKMQPQRSIERCGKVLMTLNCQLIPPDDRGKDEELVIAVNSFTGAIRCENRVLGDAKEISELETMLNDTRSSDAAISEKMDRLGAMLLDARFSKAINGMQVRPVKEEIAERYLSKFKKV